jgi:chromosome segregation ATPase
MKSARAVSAVFAVVAVAALAWSLWLRNGAAALQSQIAASGEAQKAAESRAAALESDNVELRRRLEASGIAAPPPSAHAAPSAHPSEQARIDAIRTLADLQKRYDALQSQVQSLTTSKSELEASLETANSERRRIAASESDLRDALASSRRVVEAMETELKTKTDRIASQEAELRRVRDAGAADTRRTSQIASILTSFEDLNRRRENTLTSLQRRFRDLTDSYRALALRLDTQRDNPSPAPISSAEVSRITAAVQSAEDEIRQLNALNAESQRLTRRLQN